jgi:serine protease
MKIHAFGAIVLIAALAACNNQPSNPSSVSQPSVTVAIDASITPQQFRALAATPGLPALGVIETSEGKASFLGDQIVVKLPSANRAQALEQILKRRAATLLDDNRIPTPPSTIPRSELRPVADRGYRLIGLTPSTSDRGRLVERLTRAGYKGVVKFSSDAAADLFNSVLSVRQDDPAIAEYAEPNWVAEPNAVYNDHLVGGSYLAATDNDALTNLNVSQPGGAWDYKYGGVPVDGRGVQIAILDAGFDPSNYEMTGYDPTLGYAPYTRTVWQYDFHQSDYNVSVTPNEDCVGSSFCYHGLGTSSVAAGIRGNHYGTAGVAPRADLFLFRTSGYSFFTQIMSFYNASRAVDTAVAWGADVINMSFGTSLANCGESVICYLASAVVNAKNAGLIILASGGNNNCRNEFNNGSANPCYETPGMWADVIGVGAHDRNFYRSKWGSAGSSYGASMDIWAPGGGGSGRSYGYLDLFSVPTPQSTYCYGSAQCSTQSNASRLFSFNGTSAASPHAAGVAALMKQIKPSITQAEVLYTMQANGRIGPDPEVGRILDARAAIYALGARP